MEAIEELTEEYQVYLQDKGRAFKTSQIYKGHSYRYLLYLREHYKEGKLYKEYQREYLRQPGRKSHKGSITSFIKYLHHMNITPEMIYTGEIICNGDMNKQ